VVDQELGVDGVHGAYEAGAEQPARVGPGPGQNQGHIRVGVPLQVRGALPVLHGQARAGPGQVQDQRQGRKREGRPSHFQHFATGFKTDSFLLTSGFSFHCD